MNVTTLAGFLPIPGYERFLINGSGVVINSATGNTLNPSIDGRGYRAFTVHNKGVSGHEKGVRLRVHRAVALTFIPNPEEKGCINHIDGDKLNNCIGNLEWCSYSENSKHAYDTGLRKATVYKGSRKDQPVVQLTLAGVEVSTYASVNEVARAAGIPRQTIYRNAGGRVGKPRKYIWRYV